MKSFLAIAALVIFQFADAQKTIELEPFKRITIGSDIKLDLVKSNDDKLVFNSEETFEVEYNNDDNLVLNGEGNATLYYKNDIESITLGSDAILTCKDEINGKNLQLTAGADSKATLSVNLQELQITAGSDAKVVINGKAKRMSATIGSDADYNSEKLNVEDVTINIGSDGKGTITATGMLTTAVGSDGYLKVYGKPKKVSQIKDSNAKIIIVK